MTWTLASFAILFLAIAAGFGWYERSHPTSKTLALVATLAALGVIGRIAFAPFPNIKPTTDIVLFAGFALGAAPGFAVGAVCALTSNFVFGQGPWTPWQMVGFGLFGLVGALLSRWTRGDASRLQLAIACGATGAFYGMLLDFQDWLVFAPERSWAQWAAIFSSSLSFNIALVVGNVVFAATLGPAFLQMLARFRSRSQITWLAPATGALLVVATLGHAAAAPPQASAATATGRALTYLNGAQNGDGGWGGAKGASSSPLYSGWALLGQAAAGRCNARGVAYVRRTISRVQSTGDIERTLLALRACRAGAGSLGSTLARRQGSDGSFNALTNITSFGVLALRANGMSRSDRRISRAASFIARQQNGDGGFSYARKGAGSGVDDTAAAVQALVAAGRSTRRGAVKRAVAYLRSRQGADGGFGASPGLPSNAQSTAWAIQAFAAAKVNPEKVKRSGSRSPLAYLRTLVAGDGSVRYSRTSAQTPVWVTAQALTGLTRRPFPIR